MDPHDEASYSDEQTDPIMEMYCQGGIEESYEDKKLKRRESDAKCRANISAGFDLLKEQVYATGSQDKVSKESILQQSFVRIKYLEGVLVALQQTKGYTPVSCNDPPITPGDEISNGRREKLQDVSPLQQLRNIYHQFVASQQRKWSRHRLPIQRPAEDTPTCRNPKERQEGIRRMAKRRRPKHRPFKKSPLIKWKKRSPIIHLPPALHTPSRPQKRIKLASTETNQDQVVPLCSILNPSSKMPLLTSTKKGAGPGWVGSQRVPHSPQIGNRYDRKEDVQQENLYTNDTRAPPSTMVDVCTTPRKAALLGGSSLISTPMKTYQIIGTSITPVKMDYHVESQENSDIVPATRILRSPDLVCDEEPTSWPEDDSSSSSGSIPELHIGHPWFSTPVRPTSLLLGNQPPGLPAKQQRPPSMPPILEPRTEIAESRRKKLFKGSSGDENGANLKPKCTTPRKKYRKRATAARVRAWDSATGRVLSPVQPYSGVFKSIQQRKMETSIKSKSPAADFDSPTEYLGQKLRDPDLDAPMRHIRSTIRERLVGQLDSDIVYISGFAEESDEEIIDLLGPDSAEIKSSSADNVVPTMCMDDDNHSEDSSPTCLRDVSLPPPAGTISPPSLALHSMEYDESPELFKGFRSIWLKDAKGDNCIAWDVGPERDNYQHIDHEDGFYDYQHQARCDPDDAAMLEQEEDLFEADLGDMRHLDPALQPPSSSLDSEDYIIRLRENELEELDHINVVDDVEENNEGSCHAKQSQITNDVLITPALASFATSALSLNNTRRTNRKVQRRRRNVRLNLPKVSTASGEEEEDDLNIWKFTQAALNEKDVLQFLPTDSSYALMTNNY